MKAFWEGDQLAAYARTCNILACTDGSCVAKAGGPRMGAGIAYRNGDGPEGALTYHNVQGTIGSFVAEGMSLNTCINSVPIDIPVTIGIDNAALIYDLERCTFETFWKTMEGHEHAEMLTQLVQNINKRTASTKLVKIKAHRGQPLNEQADALAKKGTEEGAPDDPSTLAFYAQCKETIQIDKWDNHEGNEQPLTISKAIIEVTKKAKEKRILDTADDAPKTTVKVNNKTIGTHIKAKCMLNPKMSRNAVRAQIQWVTRKTPCAAWRATWGRDLSTTCPLCGDPLENVVHIQLHCPRLQDAKTKAHNTCWRHIWARMVEALQALGYDTYFETELQDIPDFPYNIQGLERRRPDATLIQRRNTQSMINLRNNLTGPTKRQKIDNTNRKVIFLDFARTAGNTVDRLKENRDNKYQNQYKELINALTAQEIDNWTVEAHILNGSYAAAVDIIYWKTILSSLGLSQPTIDKVIETAVFQLCEVYWDVEKTRLVALRTPADKTSSHERNAVRPSSKGLAGCAP
jgi:ribonuclease HI